MWDICIRGARVYDPGRELDCTADVAVAGGTIAAVGPELGGEAKTDIDGAGCLLTPGLVDVHAHVGGAGVAPLSLETDDVGVRRGVTLVGDAGTSGAANVDALLENLAAAATPVAVFLNIHPHGIARLPQDWSAPLDFDALSAACERHGGRIAGLKLLATADFAAAHGIAGLRRIQTFAKGRGLPLMVHLGTSPADVLPADWEQFSAALPHILDAGDILSHCYTGKPGGLITPDRRFYPQLRRAVARGVVLDAAVALTHFSFARARQGLDDGFLPHCISTDLTMNNAQRGVFDLPTTMSRFVALGMPLAQVITCVTDTPRRVLGRAPSAVRVGEAAQLSLLRVHDEPCLFGEGDETLAGHMRLSPVGVCLGERYVARK